MEDKLNFKIGRLFRLETDGPIKAFVDIVVNEAILIKGLRVIEGKNGLFVSLPKDKGKDNRWYDIIRPITKETRNEISNVILSAYSEK
ncbi:MAG: SpoVG family protein [Candidatus Omnitrophota bacterium]